MKKVTAKTVKNAILKDIAADQQRIAEHEKIAQILKPLEGKEIDGRILNEKRLNGLKFVQKYGMYYIEGQDSHLIGYERSENLIAVEKTGFSRGFEYFDNCAGGAAKARIKQNEDILNNPVKFSKLVLAFSSIEKHYEGLKQAVKNVHDGEFQAYNFPAHYDCLRLVQSEEKDNKVKLNDFAYL